MHFWKRLAGCGTRGLSQTGTLEDPRGLLSSTFLASVSTDYFVNLGWGTLSSTTKSRCRQPSL